VWRYSPEQVLPRSLIELTFSVDFALRELLAPAEGSVVGDVDGLLIELLALSIVPFTSTLWLTYFERSSLALALSFRPLRYALDEDAVPVVPAVLLAAVSLPPADTLFNTKSPADVVELGLAVVPVVPVADDALSFCRQPVTVTVLPLMLCRSLCALLGDVLWGDVL
jgi:hypothetical protein